MSDKEETSLVTDGIAPLSKREQNGLHALGWKSEDLKAMGPNAARANLANRTPKPGSKRAIAKQIALQVKAGNPNPSELMARHSNEAIAERNKTLPAPSGAFVVTDEFTNRCIAGDDPLDATLLAYESDNPGKRFRLINPDLPPARGPQFQQVYGVDGKAVVQSGLALQWMPEEIYDKHYRQPNAQRSELMTGQIPTNAQEDGDLKMNPSDAAIAPIEGQGLTVKPITGRRPTPPQQAVGNQFTHRA